MRCKRLWEKASQIQLKSLIILMLAVIFLALIAVNFLFYAVSSQALQEQSNTYFSSISAQIQQNVQADHAFVENAVENVCNTAWVQQYLYTGNDLKTHKSIVDSLQSIAVLNDCIETIKIVSPSVTISVAEQEPIAMFLLMQQYDVLHIQPDRPFFTQPRLSEDRQASYYLYVYPIRSVELDTFREYIGTALILINLDRELTRQETGLYLPSTTCMVLDRQDTVLYSTGSVDADAFYTACRQEGSALSDSISSVRYDGETYYFTSSLLPGINWGLLTAVPQKVLSGQLDRLQTVTILLSAGSGLLILAAAFFLIRNIYRPIRFMTEGMSQVSLGDHSLRIQSSSKNELGELADHINHMLDELNQSARKIIYTQNHLYELELAEKKSQMLALQSQINPHFLYNTLECIQSIAVMNHVPEIAAITSAMSRIFRYAIGESGTASLSEELACVKHYLTIMRIRFDCDTRLELEIPDECLELPVLRMVLQPIVENAFNHGLERDGGEGLIRITAVRREKTLSVCVANSGNSLSAEAAEEMNRTLRRNPAPNADANINGGVALVNIHRRLQLYGGMDSGIRVSVTAEGLTCFTLTFPIGDPPLKSEELPDLDQLPTAF